MRHVKLGSLDVSCLGLGTMGMSTAYAGAGTDDAESIRTIHRALALGVNFIDTAEAYGPYVNEELVAKALAGRRDEVVLATKFGLFTHRGGDGLKRGIDSHPDNIRVAIEGSLRRLETDYIDLYYQHRVDPQVPIEEVIGVLAGYVEQGKIRAIGLSDAGPETIRRAHAVHPISALQSEWSLWTRDPEADGLPVIRELGIGFVPYSPLGRGFLTGSITSRSDLPADDFRSSNPRFVEGAFEQNMAIVDEVRAVAAEIDATAGQVALAWLLSKGDDVAPIPGTKRVSRLEENASAAQLHLGSEQLARLDALQAPQGDRYPDMSMVGR